MSRSPHLPPRCPPQLKLSDAYTSFTEQPLWLDDLLSEPDRVMNAAPLRRAASDSDAILDVLKTTYHGGIIFPIEESDPLSDEEAENSSDVADHGGGGEQWSKLEAGCVYGPNSPRHKGGLSSSESSMVNAVLENVMQNPLQQLAARASSTGSYGKEFNDTGDAASSTEAEKAAKRRSGQRSRVRKLQYIAELEKTVESLQNIGAEMALRVASLFQLRASLSMENKQLRKQIASLQHEKLFKEGQNHSLKNEVERLRELSRSSSHRRSKSFASCYEGNQYYAADPSTINWQMLDMGRLDINGTPAHPGLRFGPRFATD